MPRVVNYALAPSEADPVRDMKWFNSSLPQTLVTAQMLCYLEAVFALLQGAYFSVIAIALAVGAFGVANERKWGYVLATGAAAAQVLLALAIYGVDVLRFQIVMTFVFDVALAALLLHPESRNYVRTWFR
jgi:hypothetical protein